MKLKIILTIFASIISAISSFADISMPKIFSDNVVLQQQLPVKIWGNSAANAKVDVSFAGQKKSAKANNNGEWLVILDPLKANKNPSDIIIYENGKESAQVKNVVVGEVWILGGQSNMAWGMGSTTDAAAAKARSDYPIFRHFYQPHDAIAETPQKDSMPKSRWDVSSPEKSGSFSAVGFYFGEKLMKDLDVPVGLVNASTGATNMYCWITEEDCLKNEFFKKNLDNFKKQKALYTPEIYQKKLEAFNKKIADHAAAVAKAKKEKTTMPKPLEWAETVAPIAISPIPGYGIPAYSYNAKVAPIANFTARGILWYQGEANSSLSSVDTFDEQFSILIDRWRKTFGQEQMPFIFVQLPSYDSKKYEDWAKARWKQFEIYRTKKNVGMATTVDLGDPDDIHPRAKTEFGVRLENIALRMVYGAKKVNPFSPTYKETIYKGSTATVSFNAYGRKLVEKGEPRGFEVLVDDNWVLAKVKLASGKVIVSSPDGAEISGVRYLWWNCPLKNVWLFNQDGLPATSLMDLKKIK